ncbi:Pimeloyl-ACP methyl ester carboxylesterase [Halobacillus dabanensis]|uniref:Pimeloyl-ACP methyl ester carboxylesterase n=1 Tax=Halobacillus dabanensis TaxID=240302 RepID=A0A1I3TYC4_HALDA|nr:alpha/beta hydrolase [Halobacillus dabanensis]SFJ76298.1 Pimeloyl-ACP methyl ester carboxylesterase [Halobacillus dabanensis]
METEIKLKSRSDAPGKAKQEPTLDYKAFLNEQTNEWVVFLHGFGGNHTIFFKQMDYFKKHFNLLFIDLPGHGQSPFHAGVPCLLTGTSQHVISVMDNLSIESAHFLGVSLGTIVMQSIALEYPKRIKSMTLGGAAGKWLKWGEILGKITVSPLFRQTLPYMVPFQTFAHIMMPKRKHSFSRNIFIREARNLGQHVYLGWASVIRDSHKVYDRLRKSTNTIPKLYVSGAEDYMFLRGITNHVNKETSARLHIIQKCGHVCNIEKAAEFNEVALDFINMVVQTGEYGDVS